MESNLSMGLAWIVFGIGLVVAEFFVPGAIVVFFGVGAILTGLAVMMALLVDLPMALLFWAVTSTLLVLAFRGQIKRWFPSLEKYEPGDEENILIGTIVEVIREVHSDNEEGRVRYQGTSWKAKAASGSLAVGSQEKITGRSNLLLHVVAARADELSDSQST